jgi:hypothetical protein
MSEDLLSIQGEPLGREARGIDRQMYRHKQDPDLLVGVEYHQRPPIDMELYHLTAQIFYRIFPNYFPHVISVGASNDKSYAVVREVKAEKVEFGPKYREGKAKFLAEVGKVFSEEDRPYLEEAFDFEGTLPNLLISPEGYPVYVDKIEPVLAKHIDRKLLEEKVTDPNELKEVIELIDKTIALDEKREEKRKQMEGMGLI